MLEVFMENVWWFFLIGPMIYIACIIIFPIWDLVERIYNLFED